MYLYVLVQKQILRQAIVNTLKCISTSELSPTENQPIFHILLNPKSPNKIWFFEMINKWCNSTSQLRQTHLRNPWSSAISGEKHVNVSIYMTCRVYAKVKCCYHLDRLIIFDSGPENTVNG